jgi:hypothetical protein
MNCQWGEAGRRPPPVKELRSPVGVAYDGILHTIILQYDLLRRNNLTGEISYMIRIIVHFELIYSEL